MRHWLVLLLAALTLGMAAAQAPVMTWGQVPEADLKMTVYEPDTSAAAVVLFDAADMEVSHNTSQGLKYEMKRHRRVKILTRAGFEYADVSIPFYDKRPIEKLKAQIIQPDGTVTPLGKADFFDEKMGESFSRRKFTFPGLQEGSVVEYSYTIRSSYVGSLPDWYFQSDIPVRWSEYRQYAPEWLDYAMLSQGAPPDTFYVSDNKSTRYMAMAHVPALKLEGFTTTEDDYLSSVRFLLKTIHWPGGRPFFVLSTWNNAARELLDDRDFGMQFRNKTYHKLPWKAAKQGLPRKGSDAEIAAHLYRFVSESMEWDERYGIFARQSLSACFQQKRGSTAEINLLLIALLRRAGIDAKPLLCSTRDNGKMQEYYPYLSQFNHVMAIATLDDKTVILDAGSRFRPMNYPRIPALNGRAWVVDPLNPRWIDIPAFVSSSILMLKQRLDENGDLAGEFTGKYEGYEAVSHRDDLDAEPADAYWQKYLAVDAAEATLTNAEVQHLKDLSQPLKVRAECSFQGRAQASGDFLYLSPVISPPFNENPFKLATRTYPVEVPYPIVHQFVLQLELPEGYAVEEIPKGLSLSLPEEGGSFVYGISQAGNTLVVTSKLRIDQLYFAPEEYPGLKTFFDLMLAKQAEQIVLKRQ